MKDLSRWRRAQKVFSNFANEVSFSDWGRLYIDTNWNHILIRSGEVAEKITHTGQGNHTCNGMLAFCISICLNISFVSFIVIHRLYLMCKNLFGKCFAATTRGR